MNKMLGELFQGKKFVGSNLIKANIWFMVVFVLNVTISFMYMAYSVQADYQQVRQAADLRIQLLTLENALVDQETGQRGFLLSGKEEFLEPFDQGAQLYERTAATLLGRAEHVSESADFKQNKARLIEIGRSWKKEYGDPQVRKVMVGGTVTNTDLEASRSRFDSFRSLEAELLAFVEQLRDKRRTDMLHNLYYLFAIMGTIFVAVQSFMLYYLQKGLTRIAKPIIELDQAVASYKGGNIQATLPAYGEANEIGRLIENFRLMHEEMEKEKRTLDETYQMINVLNQARSVEESYRVTLQSIGALVSCDRLSIIIRSGDRGFAIKAVFENSQLDYRDIPLGGEEGDMYQLLRGGFSILHEDWSKYRAKGSITDGLYENGIRSSLHIILKKEARVFGVLNLLSKEPHAFSVQQKERLEQLSPMIVTALENAKETTRIQDMALHDGLTGLWNRRYFEACMDTFDVERGQKGPDYAFSLILLDVDRFKLFNDNWGHQEGDLVLKYLAQLLETCVRPGDVPVRFGGEEFAVLLPHTRLEEAEAAAERIRRRLESESPSRKYKITASFGVAEWTDGFDRQQLIEAADRALYQAKETGRNRVCAYREEPGGELV
ncbi:sensor domain-containing diguanylate cyclase [Saccharibacillus qingshengii]|uniref:sensor domain-containing diguanylate cyclase n=1 Tax=Saccharibacillus qingshengii TaxID=1763540 RepID=UPI001FE9A687|nr:diguanylate cyclase [Saccharibacillus qingshengii]